MLLFHRSKFVQMGLSLAISLQTLQKYCILVSGRMGKECVAMKDVQNAIFSIVETRGKECYCILCHAIDIAIEYQPNMPQMKSICIEVCKRTPAAISRALNRASKDIWQNGKRELLRSYWIEDAPTAKELISLVSAKLWSQRQEIREK